MVFVLALVYIILCICLVYPPTEFESAGFTIPSFFSNYLGSENTNFVLYHLRRITITVLIHSCLILPFVCMLLYWLADGDMAWVLPTITVTAIIPLTACYKLASWLEGDRTNHPAVKPLLPYVTQGSDWRVVAAALNGEYCSIDMVSMPLSATSKIVATPTWLIKVSSYSLNIVKQTDCRLVATATDYHDLSSTSNDIEQYLNIEVIPSRNDIKCFSFRLTRNGLRDIQPRLLNPVQLPENLTLLPTLIERFITVFRQHVDNNPVYYVDEELETCIGCLQNQADVKIEKHCLEPPAHLNLIGPPPCQKCNCRAVWCCSCVARWWATRAARPHSAWLSARATCPICRAGFCLLDVCPARRRPNGSPTHN